MEQSERMLARIEQDYIINNLKITDKDDVNSLINHIKTVCRQEAISKETIAILVLLQELGVLDFSNSTKKKL